MHDRAIPFYIKRKIVMVVTLVILTVAWLAVNAYADTGVVNTGVANIRSGPDTNNAIVGTVYKDSEVNILETSGDWYKIKLGNLTGWMSKTVLDTKNLQIVVVTGDKVNLRSGPGISYDIVGQVLTGDKIGLLAAEGDWFKVKTGSGTVCYIAASLAQKEGAASPPATVVTPPRSVTTEAQYIQVISGPINVRSGAGTNFAETAKIDESKHYAIMGREGDWIKIALPEGKTDKTYCRSKKESRINCCRGKV